MQFRRGDAIAATIISVVIVGPGASSAGLLLSPEHLCSSACARNFRFACRTHRLSPSISCVSRSKLGSRLSLVSIPGGSPSPPGRTPDALAPCKACFNPISPQNGEEHRQITMMRFRLKDGHTQLFQNAVMRDDLACHWAA